MEILAAVAVVVALVVGYAGGKRSSAAEITVRDRTLDSLYEQLEERRKVNGQLIDTILQMRQEGKVAPPLDDTWGVYTMDAEDEDA